MQQVGYRPIAPGGGERDGKPGKAVAKQLQQNGPAFVAEIVEGRLDHRLAL